MTTSWVGLNAREMTVPLRNRLKGRKGRRR